MTSELQAIFDRLTVIELAMLIAQGGCLPGRPSPRSRQRMAEARVYLAGVRDEDPSFGQPSKPAETAAVPMHRARKSPAGQNKKQRMKQWLATSRAAKAA